MQNLFSLCSVTMLVMRDEPTLKTRLCFFIICIHVMWIQKKDIGDVEKKVWKLVQPPIQVSIIHNHKKNVTLSDY